HWYYGLLFFLGAAIAFAVERRRPRWAAEFTFPVASGVVAGGSLVGVLLGFWGNGGSILETLLGDSTRPEGAPPFRVLCRRRARKARVWHGRRCSRQQRA